MHKKVGNYSFVIGVLIALVLGLFKEPLEPTGAVPWLTSLVIVLGLIVGFLNVTGKETKEFLLSSTLLTIVVWIGAQGGGVTGGVGLGSVQYIGTFLQGLLQSILAFVVPSIIVVALKEIVRLAKTK
ncbi:hypothetical protein ACFLZX_04380 [Nanoarchaeota archaeon]